MLEIITERASNNKLAVTLHHTANAGGGFSHTEMVELTAVPYQGTREVVARRLVKGATGREGNVEQVAWVSSKMLEAAKAYGPVRITE